MTIAGGIFPKPITPHRYNARENRMRRQKHWIICEAHPQADRLAARLSSSPILAQILLNRGLSEVEECLAFLRPSFKSLHDPSLVPGLPAAAERITRAVRERQKIVIYGDYDVDGITATAILWHTITLLGGDVDYYIPHRLEEGYGLNAEALQQICAAGAKLIVSVDCGITAIEPANVPLGHGVDLIITDHHEYLGTAEQPQLPCCAGIVHPRLPGTKEPYPNPHLCGAGVAFKLACGIGLAMNGSTRVAQEVQNFLAEAMGLATLGTIADVVPLRGENRVIAHLGLAALRQSKLAGIRALIASANLVEQELDSHHIGFVLAPRLNAAGRMGHAATAVAMLTTATPQQATEIAGDLERRNRERQQIENTILEQALEQIVTKGLDGDDCPAIVLGAEGWHSGVIGIVASRLVDRFHRPTILVGFAEGRGQGSGRSISGFRLSEALAACAAHLDAFGGHEMAAGVKVSQAGFEGFRAAFCRHAAAVLGKESLGARLTLDCVAELRQITMPLVTDLQRMAPFGQGNRRPLLCVRDVTVTAAPRRVGKTGEHLQIQVRQGDVLTRCIAFNHGAEWFDKLPGGTRLDLAVEAGINKFNGCSSLELQIKDLRRVAQ